MSAEEIQRLMARYSTGSLSEAERSALFEAALDDQELFNQLAQEDAVRELIDQPGVRDRLIGKLAPQPIVSSAGWKKPLAWGLSGAFVVGMSLTAVFVMRSTLPVPVASTVAPVPEPAPAPASAPPAQIARNEPARKRAAGPDRAANEIAISKDKAPELDASRADQVTDLKKSETQQPTVAPSVASQAAPVAAPAPPPAQFAARSQQQSPAPAQQQSVPAVAGQIQIPGAAGGGGRGGSAGAVGGAPRAAPSTLLRDERLVRARFGFDYSVEGEDVVFKFTADGYLSLHVVPGGLTIVDSRVTAGSTRREHINNNGTELDIVFSAARQSTDGGVKLTSNLRKDSASDPSATRIELLVKLYPPPQ